MKKSEKNNSFSLHINGIKMYISNKSLNEIINIWALELAAKIS
jgi:hypothetical protein